MTEKTAKWELRIYAVGMAPAAERELANIKDFTENHLDEGYHIEVIDISKRPLLAENEQIFAVPTMVRKLPEPLRILVGNLLDKEKALVGLDIKSRE